MRLLAPRRLVETSEGGPRVWIADQTTQTARLRTVRLGLMAGELVEILDGLQPGDRLIGSGREGLREGQRIRVTAEEQSK